MIDHLIVWSMNNNKNDINNKTMINGDIMRYTHFVAQPAANLMSNHNIFINKRISGKPCSTKWPPSQHYIIIKCHSWRWHVSFPILNRSSSQVIDVDEGCTVQSEKIELCQIISNAYASPRHVNACYWLQVAVKKSKSPRGCSLVHQGRSTNQHTFNWKLHTNNPRNAERFTQTPTMMMLLNIYLPSNMAIFWVSVFNKHQGEYVGAFTTIMFDSKCTMSIFPGCSFSNYIQYTYSI